MNALRQTTNGDTPVKLEHWLRELFETIDGKSKSRFLEFLTDDASFYFGNFPPCHGKQDIGAAVDAFFGSIKACHHEVLGSWRPAGHAICHGLVTYTKKDGVQVTVPFANILALKGELICNYRIFVDISPLLS
jgi:hypothetical protein